jgi:hypothetical protein
MAGNNGTRRGPAKNKPWSDALRLAVNESGPDGLKRLRKIAEACVNAAEAGDMQAMREIGDRLDGKPAQTTDLTVRRAIAKELADDELADIALGGGEGAADEAVGPSQLN